MAGKCTGNRLLSVSELETGLGRSRFTQAKIARAEAGTVLFSQGGEMDLKRLDQEAAL